jgi:hypothetical protein
VIVSLVLVASDLALSKVNRHDPHASRIECPARMATRFPN